jgi:hypothetical protein
LVVLFIVAITAKNLEIAESVIPRTAAYLAKPDVIQVGVADWRHVISAFRTLASLVSEYQKLSPEKFGWRAELPAIAQCPNSLDVLRWLLTLARLWQCPVHQYLLKSSTVNPKVFITETALVSLRVLPVFCQPRNQFLTWAIACRMAAHCWQ